MMPPTLPPRCARAGRGVYPGSGVTARRRGFTLIELLTVIAIVGILAAILIPVVGKVRGSAKTTQSLSNLRQIGLACQLYMDENRGWMPDDGNGDPAALGTAGQPGTVPWYNALPPYVGEKTIAERSAQGQLPNFSSKTIFVCPRAGDYTTRAPSYAWRCYGPSYLIDGVSGNRQTNRSMVREPTRTVMFSELTFHTPRDVTNPAPDNVSNANPNFLKDPGAQRHDGRALVAFFDGSVRSFTADELRQQHEGVANPDAPVRWNPQI